MELFHYSCLLHEVPPSSISSFICDSVFNLFLASVISYILLVKWVDLHVSSFWFDSCWSFFLKGLTELTKISVTKRAWTCHLLFKRSRCFHSTSKTSVRDRIFKLSPIHALVIYYIPGIYGIQYKFCTI